MSIAWEGVIIVWIVVLWPLLVSGGFLLWKSEAIVRKGKFFISSVVVGYLGMILGNVITYLLVKALVDPEAIGRDNADAESLVNLLIWIGMGLPLLLPVLSTYFLVRRFG